MEAADIVEALNQYHEEQGIGGQFVLHKTIEPNETVKAYKRFEFIVWFIKDKNKIRTVTVSFTGRVVSDREAELADKHLCISLSKALFKFISSNDYAKIVYGV